MTELKSAWAWGAYRRGMGVETDDPRIIAACKAIKAELAYLGYELDLETTRFGPKTYTAVKNLQEVYGLTVDGMVGAKTANALWEGRISEVQDTYEIPKDWLRAQIHWESLDDPGAWLVNEDGSIDRGLIQINSKNVPDHDVAQDPAWAINFLGVFLETKAKHYRDCEVNRYKLAVGSWRTPVGAEEWCDNPDIVPSPDEGWGEQAAFYVDRVDSIGRQGWA
jgi:putative peptidoglycan binding protein